MTAGGKPAGSDGDPLKVFISYKHEDLRVAEAAKQTLERLGRNAVQVAYSQDLRSGDPLHERLRNELAAADILILLYTDPSQDWKWCMYEVGLFVGQRGADEERPVICLCGTDQKRPSPLSDRTIVTDIRTLLGDLFTTEKYVTKAIIKPSQSVWKDLDDAADDLAQYFRASPITYLLNRIVIRVPGNAPLNKALVSEVDRSGAFRLFHRRFASRLSFGDLDDNDPERRLTTELAKAFENPEPNPIPFTLQDPDSSQKHYRPLLYQQYTRPDGAREFHVAFMEETPLVLNRPINSFVELMVELRSLIRSTHVSDEIRMLAYTPAIGFLSCPGEWPELQSCIFDSRAKVVLTCLQLQELKTWHGLFRDRYARTYGKILDEHIKAANEVAEQMLVKFDNPPPYERTWHDMPGYYIFQNDVRAIIVAPSFIPRLYADPQSDWESQDDSARSVEMFGFMTRNRSIIKQARDVWSAYARRTQKSIPIQRNG